MQTLYSFPPKYIVSSLPSWKQKEERKGNRLVFHPSDFPACLLFSFAKFNEIIMMNMLSSLQTTFKPPPSSLCTTALWTVIIRDLFMPNPVLSFSFLILPDFRCSHCCLIPSRVLILLWPLWFSCFPFCLPDHSFNSIFHWLLQIWGPCTNQCFLGAHIIVLLVLKRSIIFPEKHTH